MRGRGKRNRFAGEGTGRCPKLQPLLPSPPFLRPAGRRGERRGRASSTPRENKRPPPPRSNHLTLGPSSPQCLAAQGRVTLGSAPCRPSKPHSQQEKLEGPRSRERSHLHPSLLPFFFKDKKSGRR